MVNVSAERAPQTSDVVTEADFVRRRRDRLSPEHDPALFATAYSQPVPSPDGRMLAWISDRDGRPRAFVAPLPPDGSAVAEPAWPLPTDGESGVPWDVQKIAWSPDGFWLACQLAPGGGERTRVRLVTPDGTQVHDLAPSAPAVTLGSWSPSGRQLGITVFGGGTGDGVASLVDVRDGTSTMLTSGPAALVCAISGDGMRAVVRVGRRGARRLEHFDLRSGRCTELLPGGEANVADARFGITGGQLFVHSDAGGERPALLAVGLNGDAPPSLPYVVAARDEHDLDLVALDPAGARAALVWNVEGRSEIDLLDLRSGITEPLPRPPGDVVTSAAFTRDGRALLIGNEGSTVPPTITRIALDQVVGVDGAATRDVRAGATRRIDRSPRCSRRPRATPGTSSTPCSTTSSARTGFRSRAGCSARRAPSGGAAHAAAHPDLAARRAGGPGTPDLPAAVPGAAGRRASRCSRRTCVAPAGTAARSPRPTTWTGGSSRSPTCGPRSRPWSRTGWPTRRGSGSPGRSYGGYLTLVALAWFPELFRVGVDVCGISDFATFYAQTEPWIAAAAVTKYGDPHAHAALLHELSPIHSADRITAPLLVVHGAYDTNVPIVEAEQIVEALRDRGASPGFLLFDDEGHEVHGTANRARFVHEVVRWVTAHLLDVGEQTA